MGIEWGSLSEWVAGISKVISVAGAIIYPIVQAKKNREKAIQKIIRIEWRLASYIVKEQHEHPEIDIKELYSYQEFMKNYSRTMLIGEDDQLLDLTQKLKELLVKLADKNRSSDTKEISEMLNYLKEKYKL